LASLGREDVCKPRFGNPHDSTIHEKNTMFLLGIVSPSLLEVNPINLEYLEPWRLRWVIELASNWSILVVSLSSEHVPSSIPSLFKSAKYIELLPN
jgi:hypothetical protein